ncbi:MAG: PilZ domain-containing protein [Terracidiphilus sp.]
METNTEVIPRQWERQEAQTPISLVLDSTRFKKDTSAVILDVSLGGARVRTSLALEPGEWVGVIPKGDFPHAIPSRVVWAQEDSYSHWTFAGIEFIAEHMEEMAA